MIVSELLTKIKNGALDGRLTELYGSERTAAQRKRYIETVTEFERRYGGDRDAAVFSVPGRSEICGNHTDHNRGCVIAAAVDLDIIAVASKNESGIVNVDSKGFPPDSVSCTPEEPAGSRFFTSSALISGVCAGFLKRGYNVGGFDACTASDVRKGSGISSSAAFEVAVATMLNYFYNGNRVSAPEMAQISQYAENVYFGKPSGLMDQTACAVGGFSIIDFADPKAAEIEKSDFNISEKGYSLCITDTGGNHADLNADYASVPAEMKAVAAMLGREVLRGVTADKLIGNAARIRKKLGDRALLRAYHFAGENERVLKTAHCLRSGDTEGFLDGVLESGRSSFMWLQNVYTTANVKEQGISVALALTGHVLAGAERKAAWRVHGGGFAGTVLAIVPDEEVTRYREAMDAVFGENACTVMKVRSRGAVVVAE